ncbi:hypothetical protein [Microvirga soli]|uniref:hypothetical protein n=1 Tax=Microvirga soli TaxID=1854496 RepID=UPI00191D3100|nr:hypothetical protein [Microvirga soli]
MVGDTDVICRTGASLDLGKERTTRRLHVRDLTLQGRHLSMMFRNPTVDRLNLRFQIVDLADKIGRRSTDFCSHHALHVGRYLSSSQVR